jgi:hypothetical protein
MRAIVAHRSEEHRPVPRVGEALQLTGILLDRFLEQQDRFGLRGKVVSVQVAQQFAKVAGAGVHVPRCDRHEAGSHGPGRNRRMSTARQQIEANQNQVPEATMDHVSIIA